MRLSWTTAPISSMQQANLFLATGVAKSLTTTAWLRRRFRMYIWKQWKKPKTKVANLRKLGISADKAYQSELAPLQTKSSHRRDILTSQLITSLFVKCTYAVEQSCTGRYARWCGRLAGLLFACILPDCRENNGMAAAYDIGTRDRNKKNTFSILGKGKNKEIIL